MKKYLAVIKDAFRAAFASRVMWVVMILITLLLAVVAPLGYDEVVTWELGENDVRPWPEWMQDIREEVDKTAKTPGQRIFRMLDEDLQDRLVETKIPGIDPDAASPFEFIRVFGRFRKAVNNMLKDRELYDEEHFADVRMMSQELRDLRDKGIENLEELEVARFNRLLLEASFPDRIRSSPPTSIQLKYGWGNVFDPVPSSGDNVRNLIQSNAAWVMNFSVGVVGILVAILVTAPIIPEMFEAGSLHLLLSKPVSRWLLFLSRYFGGCAFILIGASYLVGGLWLVLGTRFGVWDPKLLLSIPIYLFVFAIYYSVSSLAGAMFRSPIVAIGLTVVFWFVCWLAGSMKGLVESAVWNPSHFVNVFEAGDSLIGVNEIGIAHKWDQENREWDEVFVSQEQRQIRGTLLFILAFQPTIPSEFRSIGPVYDAEHDRLISAQPKFPPTTMNLNVADRSDEWDPDSMVAAPIGTRKIFRQPDGKLLVVGSTGLNRITGDPLSKEEPVKLFGFAVPLPQRGPFTDVNPEEPVLLASPADAAMNPVTGQLAIYTRGVLTILKAGEGGYERITEKTLYEKGPKPIVLGFAGDTLLLGRADGSIDVVDPQTWETVEEFTPEGRNQPRFITASTDGKWFAIVFHNKRLWLFNAESGEFTRARVSGQGGIASATFSDSGDLLVVDQATRVTRYALPNLAIEQRYSPRLEAGGIFYRYILVPIYTVFPKPGEMDKTFQYFLSGKETESADSSDLSSAQHKLNPWTPIWSSAIFTAAVLLISCVYIQRQDF